MVCVAQLSLILWTRNLTYPALCFHESIEPHPRTNLLDPSHKRRAKCPRIQGIVRRVLRHVNRVEMSRVCHCEHKIKHWWCTLLGLVPILLEHPRAVRKRISDRSIEIRHYALQQRARRVRHRQKLILAKGRG